MWGKDNYIRYDGFCGNHRNITEAKLDDGSIVTYDMCQSEDGYLKEGSSYSDSFEFIGFGTTHSINGQVIRDSRRMAFFKGK